MSPKRTGYLSHDSALDDFQDARRKAALQAVLGRISGKSADLLSFDEVRAKLGGVETSFGELKDIPLELNYRHGQPLCGFQPLHAAVE